MQVIFDAAALGAELREAIVADGYGSPVVFALAMETNDDMNHYINSLIVDRGFAAGAVLTDDNFRYSPVAGQLYDKSSNWHWEP
jgi:hypothetical protein